MWDKMKAALMIAGDVEGEFEDMGVKYELRVRG
jgi:hypothetical protein